MKLKYCIIFLFFTSGTLKSQFNFDGVLKHPYSAIDCQQYAQNDYISLEGLADMYSGNEYPSYNTYVYYDYVCENQLIDFMTQSTIAFVQNQLDTNYNGAQLMAGNSFDGMNCFGYAWHAIESGDYVILGIDPAGQNPSAMYEYINQNIIGYYMTEISNPNSFPSAIKVMYPQNVAHAAITTRQSDVFISKWDSGLLVKHEWDENKYFKQGFTCSYQELKFYAPGTGYGFTKEIKDKTFIAGTYLFSKKIEISNVKLDLNDSYYWLTPEQIEELAPEDRCSDWMTFDATQEISITGEFEATKNSAFIMTVSQ